MDQKDQKKNDDLASQVLEHLKNPPVEVIDPKGSGSSTKKYLIAATILIIIGTGSFALWKFVLADTSDQSASVASEEQSEEVDGDASANGLSQEYSSDSLLIDIKHPANWKVDESSGEIIVYSPAQEAEDVSGESLASEFRVMIKQGAGEPDSEYLGRGFAISKSEPIKYTDPASNQREESFLTNFGLDSSAYFSYFVVQGNFNLKKDETLGKDFASKADEILVSGGFYSKDSEDKTQLVSLDPDKFQSNETYKTAIEIVKTLRLR